MKLAISEVFYSLQGEGATIGFPSVFVRLGGCNLLCGGQGTDKDKKLHNGATWRCDTIEVWQQSKGKEIEEVLDNECREAIKRGANLVITGGEPLQQQAAVRKLIDYVRRLNPKCYVEIETNGTIMPDLEEVNQWNCSPKLSNSGNSKESRYKPNVLEELQSKNTFFKFVIADKKDIEEVKEFFGFIPKEQIYLMPASENIDELNENREFVPELCKENNYKFTTRLQIDIWNKKTGV